MQEVTRSGARSEAHHVLPAQVLHHPYLVEVEGALEAVGRLKFDGPGVGHALVVAGGGVVLVRVKDWNTKAQAT